MSNTKLESVNVALRSVGERPVTSLNTPLGLLAVDCLKSAALRVSSAAHWACLYEEQNGSSWDKDLVTLSEDVLSTKGVFWYSNPGTVVPTTYDYPRYALSYLDNESYYKCALIPFTEDAENCPRFWTKVSGNQVKVNPYPTDASTRAKLTFDVTKAITLPINNSDTWTIPDSLLDLVELFAAKEIALRFLGDANLVQALMNNYYELLQQLRPRLSLVASGGYNLYSGGRRRNDGQRL